MKKKFLKSLLVLIIVALTIIAVFNAYKWFVTGKQYIKISTTTTAYINSDLYVSIIAQEKGAELETKTAVRLLDADKKKVKDVEISYDGNIAIISVPEIESGNYLIEAKVSSEAGRDTVYKDIYITDGNQENVTITMDKGIYKPGDIVNFRALLTNKENDKPIKKEINICIYDGNDNKVYNETVSTSEYGILSGAFKLANEVNSGIYKIVVKTNCNETTKQFKVNPYITPKYEVNIGFDKQNYLVGDTATVNIDAKYFFGEAVSNAKFEVFVNDKEHNILVSDEQGNANFTYKIEDAKEYKIKVEAVDSSNYFVEANNSFVAGTDIFEIELLPEYGTLIEGRKNDVYVFVSNIDGSPVKSYITVFSNGYTKQIATDEKGVGKFSIDIDSVSPRYSYGYDDSENMKSFRITAENMNGEKVQKSIELAVKSESLLLSTDKVKYNQGEDIKIKTSSVLENTRNIYFFKNDKLIKMITTDLEETSVNLDDAYGLIDVFITQKGNNESRFNKIDANSFKRTIFVKPAKALNIDISTDKQEYRPGENITISFGTTDEDKQKIDAALLVSMLDNSILSLADNDLSIDNIKLALSDLQFSDEMDAATLYSCIVDDKSEQTMMALLLKQGNKSANISEISMYNKEEKSEAAQITITAVLVLGCIILLKVSCKMSKSLTASGMVQHIINLMIYVIIVVMIGLGLADEFVNITGKYYVIPLILSILVAGSTYVAWVSKLSKEIFKTSMSLIIAAIISIIYSILYHAVDLTEGIMLLSIAILIIIMAIISKINQTRKSKLGDFIGKILIQWKYALKFIISIVLSVWTVERLDYIIDIYYIAIPLCVLGIYLFNYLFNRKVNTRYKNEEKKVFIHQIVVVFAVIGVVTILSVIGNVKNFSIGNIGSGVIGDDVDIRDYSDVTVEGWRPDSSINADSNFDYTDINQFAGAIKDSNTQIGSVDSFLQNAEGILGTSQKETNSAVEQKPNNIKTETVVDEHIRNVFLESMCFIPELVATNGEAKLDLMLSDNITTWTIQTVGNTKDGRIGYGSIDNVKVFKEFFVDFELPKNLVETDKVSIPVTVHNYTNESMTTILKIKEEEWFALNGTNNISVTIQPEETQMVYIPITILKSGDFKFRVEAASDSLTDIVEKGLSILPKGYKVEKVVSTGNLDEDIEEDILFLEEIVENTASAKVKIYASTMSQTIEGMENIFKMPTGCFEQISSSLYPNILALKYLEDNKIVNEEIKEKALNYISSGYQKLLTYEVKGENGGYSLYGDSPAETVLTAYGLMELTDLKEVYEVDEKVLKEMTDFLYKKQNSNGSFTITGNHIGGASSRETLALNAYITWALSESDPKNEKLTKSVEYLKDKLDDVDDNYTLALVSNILANVEDKEVKNVVKRLVNNININGKIATIDSNISDYYGSRGNAQTIQTVALTSMALSKTSSNMNANKLLINYLISQKDTRGTWYSTQATILALKALNEQNEKNKLDNQTIIVKVNSEEQKIEIKDNALELYELAFNNLSKENKLIIDIEKGGAYYEIVEEYYVPYEKVDRSKDGIEIEVQANQNLNVNEILEAQIRLRNNSMEDIYNGMVTISIPQGFTVLEESLMLLEEDGLIEKYETSYNSVNLYLRNFDDMAIVDLNVKFRALYPVEITGLAIRAYDYYNPEVEGKTMPIQIKVNN